MTEQTEQKDSTPAKKTGGGSLRTNWVLLRKFETVIFACMLALLPFFAIKVLDITTTSLAVKQSAVDLVKDLSRAKSMAKEHGVNITVTSRAGSNIQQPAYLIQDDQRTIEEVVLQRGVSIQGSVRFDYRGLPAEPATFIIAKGVKKTSILVDDKGVISSP